MKPHVKIHENYLHRWHLLPRNRWFNVYLHHFNEPDPGRDLHDHPWWNLSVVLKGWYIERVKGASFRTMGTGVRDTRIALRKPTTAHTIPHVGPDGCWTLFITGPVVREWGFWRNGDEWVQWEEYLNDKYGADPAVRRSEYEQRD